MPNTDKEFENFAMMIPKYPVHTMNKCRVFNATGNEFVAFVDWVRDNLIQLKANEELLDIWIEKQNDLGRKTATLNNWFDTWKTPPKVEYGFTTTIIEK